MSKALTFEPDVVLLDIEGTISSQPYVTAVLYRYLREHLPAFVVDRRGDPVIEAVLVDTIALAGRDVEPVAQLLDWLAEDRKAPPLKKIQGMVWETGFAEGTLKGHIYDDALAVLTRWHAAGVPLFVFSSGSILSQKLFFGANQAGDLNFLFSGHFDTDTGAKIEAASYAKIAAAIGVAPERLLFFSDNPRELVAAKAAGLPVVHVLREDTPSDPHFPEIRSFEEVELRNTPDAA